MGRQLQFRPNKLTAKVRLDSTPAFKRIRSSNPSQSPHIATRECSTPTALEISFQPLRDGEVSVTVVPHGEVDFDFWMRIPSLDTEIIQNPCGSVVLGR